MLAPRILGDADDELVAVDKPAGMLVHRHERCPGEPALLQWVRDALGHHVFALHRIDRAASGVVVFARTRAAASRYREAFDRGQVRKLYVAVVRGYVDPLLQRIDYDLRSETTGATQRAISECRRLAITEIEGPIGRYPTARYSLVALVPITGRTHQLRRHMAHVRHPIVGDVRHGEGRHNRLFRARFGLWRLLLCATRVEIPRADGTWFVGEAPIAADVQRMLDETHLRAGGDLRDCSEQLSASERLFEGRVDRHRERPSSRG